jgi:hypothetical protein
MNILWDPIYKNLQYNYLYDRYKKSVKSYYDKINSDPNKFNPIDNMDMVIKLHYCFEYNINDFFRSSFMHNTWVSFNWKNAEELIYKERILNWIPLIKKTEYYIWLDKWILSMNTSYMDVIKKYIWLNYWVLISETIEVLHCITKSKIKNTTKAKKIKSNMIKFNKYRNILYHGSDLSSQYQIWDWNKQSVYHDFNIEDYDWIIQYFNLYENILNDLIAMTPDKYKKEFNNILIDS